jgi:amino acid adenylation domain-containing protein
VPINTVPADSRNATGSRLSAGERNRMLVEWNRTEADYPREKCIFELIEEQARRTPEAAAVEHHDEALSYREFNRRANQLAHHLRKHGVGPDTPVGVCLTPSLNLTVALLAVLKAGGACLPLDPGYPKERLEYMVHDARIPLLLTEDAIADTLGADIAGTGTNVIRLDSGWEEIAGGSGENLEKNVTPDNLAYLIYTSGSTGKPKGVMLPHRGLVNYITAAIRLYGLIPADRQLQFSSISFDIAIEEMFPTWSAGATLVLRSRDFSVAGSDFLTWARRQRLTLITVATAYWHELVHELKESGAALPETLRLVVVGGEKAQPQALEAWRKIAGARVRWINTYGPTEASVIATSYEPALNGPLPEPLPIGRPIANTRIYILDENLEPVAPGEEGELHIGGPGLARGYLDAPEATAAKFISDPFSAEPGARLYKTGDLASYRPNGEIEFRGRRDFQVKIRGFRIEPGEIETALCRDESVREAVVLLDEDSAAGKRLVAYVVPASAAQPTASGLRRHLKGRLPEYMVPAGFVFVRELPLTPNGKVDRRALLAIRPDEAADENYIAPSDETQKKLAAIWEELLGRRPIGLGENFFELGGHSLIAVRMMRRIEQAFDRKLPLAVLLEAPSIEQLAAILKEKSWKPSFPLAVPIQPLGERPVFFCVHGLGGGVLRFQDLARHTAPDQPFYGIQPVGFDGNGENGSAGENGGGQPFLRTVEDMAARYILEMRNVQPEGPYYIGGYSFGGLVAFEMARQLEAGGEEVGFLGLLDTYPGKPKSNAVLLSTLFRMPRGQQIAYVSSKLTKYGRGFRRRWDALFLPKTIKQIRSILAEAEMAYQPKDYSGSAVWIRASERALRGADNPEDDWSRWVHGGVRIVEIEGDHGSIMKEPTVAVFAERLRECLAEAQAEHGHGTREAAAVEV